MQIARVVVDVPSNQIDKAFDYKIPEGWDIEPGMRVVIPFGPRKVQGFVVELSNQSDFSKLKPIDSVLDPIPVLNEELLKLGEWLTHKTLCLKISAYQVMLPAALKVSYDKEITVVNKEMLKEDVKNLFLDQESLKWSIIESEFPEFISSFQIELKKGHLDAAYIVKEKAKKKTEKYIKPAKSVSELIEIRDTLPAQAIRQVDVINYFIDHYREVPNSVLLNELNVSAATIKGLKNKGLVEESIKEVYRDPYRDVEFRKTTPMNLTLEQEKAIIPILDNIENHSFQPFLMYGVTGSGKTEIYLQSIDAALKKGKQAIMLVPEISLTPMMVERFKGRFGSKVAVLHSGLSQGEKYDEWRKIQRKEVEVVVGARSAIFAPFKNLGIIVIDEEHESSYKQEDNPRYHARDVAIFRGNYHRCPVIMGSATPTLESFARAKKGNYQLLTLRERINNRPMPTVDIIDMREELRTGNRSMFSTSLLEQLKNRLEKKEQSVLFLNRRGFSTFVMCRNCGFTINCPHCEISLTYHKREHELKCHYCGFIRPMPQTCPECSSEHIRFFGTGTQKVEEELAKVLPEASVIRMDVDTTRRKGAHEQLLKAFGDKKADILLGTQMIAKGLDFPDVTLVGVLAADSMLHIPDFRSAEKTFQLLTQVSGRAGRHEKKGEVIIQSYTPEHYSILFASQHDFDSFYAKEMILRKKQSYPPFYYLSLVTVSHQDLMTVVNVTEKIANYLQEHISKQSIVLGPVSSPIARIKNRYRYQCMIKYKNEPKLEEILVQIRERYKNEIARNGLQINIDMNPYMLM